MVVTVMKGDLQMPNANIFLINFKTNMEKADTEESPKELVQAFSDVVKKMNGTCPDKACNVSYLYQVN